MLAGRFGDIAALWELAFWVLILLKATLLRERNTFFLTQTRLLNVLR